MPQLRRFAIYIRLSPQRRSEFSVIYLELFPGAIIALLPIIDCKTRWSATHQMLERSIRLRPVIDRYITRHDLDQFRLSDEDWANVELACQWLGAYRQATTTMSVTVQHRLSHVFLSFSLCRSTSIVVPLSTSFHFLLYCSASFRHVPEHSIAYSCTLHRHVPSRDLPEGSFALSQLDGCCLYKGLAL